MKHVKKHVSPVRGIRTHIYKPPTIPISSVRLPQDLTNEAELRFFCYLGPHPHTPHL